MHFQALGHFRPTLLWLKDSESNQTVLYSRSLKYLVKHAGNLVEAFTIGDHLLSENRKFLN